jgi:hypothetical protein
VALVLTGKFIAVEDDSFTAADGKTRSRFNVAVLDGTEVVKVECATMEQARKLVGPAKEMDPVSIPVHATGSWPKGAFKPLPATFRAA